MEKRLGTSRRGDDLGLRVGEEPSDCGGESVDCQLCGGAVAGKGESTEGDRVERDIESERLRFERERSREWRVRS